MGGENYQDRFDHNKGEKSIECQAPVDGGGGGFEPGGGFPIFTCLSLFVPFVLFGTFPIFPQRAERLEKNRSWPSGLNISSARSCNFRVVSPLHGLFESCLQWTFCFLLCVCVKFSKDDLSKI